MSMEAEENRTACMICHEPLSRYGNKAIKDGMICRNCVKLLSPWLSDEEIAVKDTNGIREHLARREENRKDVRDFLTTRKTEGHYSILFDDTKDRFIITRKKDIRRENSDVISKKDITSLLIREVPYKNSWQTVDVLFEAEVAGKDFAKVSFPVNEFPGVMKNTDEYKAAILKANEYLQSLSFFAAYDHTESKAIVEEWYEEGGLNE